MPRLVDGALSIYNGEQKTLSFLCQSRTLGLWLRRLDLNQRPLGYEPSELPDCSTPLATPTGFEPVTSAVTGQRSNQLNHEAKMRINRICKICNIFVTMFFATDKCHLWVLFSVAEFLWENRLRFLTYNVTIYHRWKWLITQPIKL